MTKPTTNQIKDIIERAQKGQKWFGYHSNPIPQTQTASTPEQYWQNQLANLFAHWQGSSTEIRAISFVFTDEPYCLSRFVFDAVVVWNGEAFRRIELDNLPECLRDALLKFQKYQGPEFLCSVGDTLMRMDEEYSHTLLSGQAYLTMDTLTVLNVRGENSSGVNELTPVLPYAVTALVSGSVDDAYARVNQDTHEGGISDFLGWITSDQDQSRVSNAHVQNFILRPLTVPEMDACVPRRSPAP